MRTVSAVRRPAALLVAGVLLSTTGLLVAGPLAGSASATTVSSVSPRFPLNNGTKTLTINGSAFGPSGTTQVTLHKTVAAQGQDDITGTPQDNSTACATGGGSCGSSLSFTADLTNAAPGAYDVVVVTAPNETDTCAQCLIITATGNPTLTSVARYNGTDGQLELRGTNLSKGTVPVFLVNGQPDAGISFTPSTTAPNNTGGTTTTSGYVSSTVLRGTYTAASTATAGKHALQVTTTDSQTSNALDFYQPQIASASPAALGQGATNIPVTINGTGYAPASSYSISTAANGDLTVGAPTATSGTAVTSPVTVTASSAASGRTVTLRGPDGGFTRSTSVFSVTAGPKFASSSNPLTPATPLSPKTRGQGSVSDITVTGSGFQPGIVFSFGAKTTATTVNNDATSATVHLVVADDAATGARDVTAINPDNGTATLAGGFTINPAPRITSVANGHAPAGSFTDVVITGTGFDTTNGVTLAVSPATGATVSGTHADSATQVSARITLANDAPAGLRDLVITNLGDGGTSTCTGCFSVDQLSVSPASGTNAPGSKTLTLTRTSTSPAFTSGTTVRLYIPGSQTYQAPIPATVTGLSDPTLTVSVPLDGVATGYYTVETTTGSTVLTCGGCFFVSAPNPPAVTTVAPATGGQGAKKRQITITGSSFYPGETVTFSGTGVTASSVTTSADHTTLTALVDIAQGAATGARDVTVRNIGDGQSGTKTGGFTVTAGPTITKVSPAAAGQGAQNVAVTVTGTNLTSSATADFGPGTSSTFTSAATDGTSAVFAVTIAGDAPTTTRDVSVTNSSDGGTGTATGAFKVTPAPVISGLSPSLIRTDGSGDVSVPDVQVNGSGFATTTTTNSDGSTTTTYPSLVIADVTATVKSVSSDGTSLVADLVVKAGATRGARAVTVINPDGGRSTLAGGLTLADVPVAPTGVTVATRSEAATISWSFPTDPGSDGGQPLTGFRIDDGDQNTFNAVTVGPDARTADLTGLVNGTTYTFTVVATNNLGDSAPGTATGTPAQATRLTSLHTPATIVAGSAVTLYGDLTKADGTTAGGARIVVRLTPAIGGARVVAVRTDGTGHWTLRIGMTYTTTVAATFAGSPGLNASSATVYRLGVATKVTRTAPASGTTTRASSVLAVKGTTSPNKAGRTIGLYTGGRLLARAVVASNGTFTINTRLARGTYTVRIAIGATPGNLAGKSTNFVIKRS